MGVFYGCRRENGPMSMKRFFVALAVGVGFCCWGESPSDSTQVVGQPSVFWHNGEWQTYKNGVWTPYGQKANEPVVLQQRVAGDWIVLGNTNSAGDSSGKQAIERTPVRRHILRTRGTGAQTEKAENANTLSASPQLGSAQSTQPNISIGQNTVGIGQRNGIGQTTIGIGQPNTGIGPRNDFAQPILPSNKPNASFRQSTRTPFQ